MNRPSARFFLITIGLLWVIAALVIVLVRDGGDVAPLPKRDTYSGQLKIIQEHRTGQDTLNHIVVQLHEYPKQMFALPSQWDFSQYLTLLDTLGPDVQVNIAYDVSPDSMAHMRCAAACQSLSFNTIPYYTQPLPVVKQSEVLSYGAYSMLVVLGLLFLIVWRRSSVKS